MKFEIVKNPEKDFFQLSIKLIRKKRCALCGFADYKKNGKIKTFFSEYHNWKMPFCKKCIRRISRGAE